MGANEGFRYSVYVVLLDEYVGTLPQMRRRNPTRDPSNPFVYVGVTSLPVDRRFDFRRATPEIALVLVCFSHVAGHKRELPHSPRKQAEDWPTHGGRSSTAL